MRIVVFFVGHRAHDGGGSSIFSGFGRSIYTLLHCFAVSIKRVNFGGTHRAVEKNDFVFHTFFAQSRQLAQLLHHKQFAFYALCGCSGRAAQSAYFQAAHNIILQHYFGSLFSAAYPLRHAHRLQIHGIGEAAQGLLRPFFGGGGSGRATEPVSDIFTQMAEVFVAAAIKQLFMVNLLYHFIVALLLNGLVVGNKISVQTKNARKK